MIDETRAKAKKSRLYFILGGVAVALVVVGLLIGLLAGSRSGDPSESQPAQPLVELTPSGETQFLSFLAKGGFTYDNPRPILAAGWYVCASVSDFGDASGNPSQQERRAKLEVRDLYHLENSEASRVVVGAGLYLC